MQLKDKLECTYETAVSRLKEWERDGSVVFLGERVHKGHRVKAWRAVSKE